MARRHARLAAAIRRARAAHPKFIGRVHEIATSWWHARPRFQPVRLERALPPIPFETARVDVALRPAPIVPGWIVSGKPEARASELMRSRDETSFTVIWECTAGSFNWTYHLDETIQILEGSIVLTDGGNPPTRLGPGDVVFFPKGSQVHWEVEGYVKKIAFFRRVFPNPLVGAWRLMRRVKAVLRPEGMAADPLGVAAAAPQA